LVTLAVPAQAANMLSLFPQTFAGATVSKPAQAYDAKTIYDYMDGHADAYLRFDFRQVYAAEYDLGGKLVVAEVFEMGSAPEAYGVFSVLPLGTAVTIGQEARFEGAMLRVWQDGYYVKVAGEEDSPAFRDFATQFAGAVVAAIGTQGARPELIDYLPTATLHPGRVAYFHTPEDLNYAQYVATDNVLQLAKGKTEVVFAVCQIGGKAARVVVVRYPTAALRQKAVGSFTKTIFSRKMRSMKDGTRLEQMQKDQFTGLRAFVGAKGEPMLALCFEAKSAALCTQMLAAVVASHAPAQP